MATLNIAGLSLPLEATPAGLLLSTEVSNLAVEPLIWVVNSIVTSINEERFTKLVGILERGEGIFSQGWSIGHPDDPLEDYTEARVAWQELTNSPPGEDSYILSICFIPKQIIIPRKALLEIIYALKKLRDSPHTVVDELTQDAAQKTNQNQNNQELTHSNLPEELDLDNIPVDDDFLRQMEERARTLEALEQAEQTPETIATASAKRRFLLVELEDADLLNESRFEQMHERLLQLQLPMLIAYHKTAMKLHEYYRSPQRKRYFPDAVVESIKLGSISLDRFRLNVTTPEPYDPYDWLGWCESVLAKQNNLTNYAGSVYVHQGTLRCWLYWRKDNGVTPALVSAILR